VGESRIITSKLSLARELWRYGEPELAERALQLSLTEVADVGLRMMEMMSSQAKKDLWPDGPNDAVYLLAIIERLEGAARPAARRRRLPENKLPQHLQATERQLWEAAFDVSRALRQQNQP
jgi:hypothetical protein